MRDNGWGMKRKMENGIEMEMEMEMERLTRGKCGLVQVSSYTV